jgi:hypothetical protein
LLGSTILAQWDLEHTNNDPVLFDFFAKKYSEIGCLLVCIDLHKWAHLAIFWSPTFLEQDEIAHEAALTVTPKTGEEANEECENKQMFIVLPALRIQLI